MKKSLKGFTLIEIIVVIAIIGILSAILIPSISGYVKKSRYTAANANAKQIFDALTASTVTSSSEDGVTVGFPDQVFSKQYLKDTYDALPDDKKDDMSVCLDGYFGVAYDSQGYPCRVAWGKTDRDNEVVGRYPDPSSVDEPADWSNWNK